MLKKILIPAAFLIVAFSVFYSCKKTDSMAAEELTQQKKSGGLSFYNPQYPMDIRLAQRYYNKLVREQGDEVKYAATKQTHKDEVNKKKPIWRKAYAGSTDSTTFVEVPIIYTRASAAITKLSSQTISPADEKKLLEGSFDRLVIKKNKITGKVTQYIVSYSPSLEYLNKHNQDASNNYVNKLQNDFSGFLEYKKWDGTPYGLSKFEAGKIVKKFKKFNAAIGNSAPDPQARMVCMGYETWCRLSWTRECLTWFDGESYVEVCGGWSYEIQFCWEECTNWQDDGQGEDPPPPTENCTQFTSDFYAVYGTVLNDKESVEEVFNTGTTKGKRFIWKVYTISDGIVLDCFLKSMDSAYLVNNGGLWRFQDLKHIKIFKTGFTIWVSFHVDDVTSTPSITAHGGLPDQKATMSLHFTVVWSASCQGVDLENGDTVDTSQSWFVAE